MTLKENTEGKKIQTTIPQPNETSRKLGSWQVNTLECKNTELWETKMAAER